MGLNGEAQSKAGDGLVHVVYDQQTGRIIQTHRCYSVDKEAHIEIADENVLAAVSEEDLARAGVSSRQDLALLSVPGTSLRAGGALVDVKSRRLMDRPLLAIEADKPTLRGDGEDEAKLSITVLTAGGEVDKHFDGELKVVTSRGKLSTEAGLVQAKHGGAQITLRSVPETVARVRVRVECRRGICRSAVTELEFV